MLFRNIMAFLAGGLLGIFTVVVFAEPLLKYAINKDVGLGIIALAPIIIIMYSLIFGTIGGILGIIIYNLFRTHKQK